MEARNVRRAARAIIQGTATNGVMLRAFGGAAVMLLCREVPDVELFRRETDDLDFVADFSQACSWNDAFAALGFEQVRQGLGLITRQAEFVGVIGKETFQVHVYSIPLKFPDKVPPP